MEALKAMATRDLIESIIEIVLGLSVFIEIVPIKINPWTAILKWIGKKLNGELSEKVNNLERSVKELKEETKEQQAVNARIRILRFGDELRIGTKHTKEHFEQTLKDIDYYGAYCADHPEFKNSITVMTTEYVKDIYRECVEKNSFLR